MTLSKLETIDLDSGTITDFLKNEFSSDSNIELCYIYEDVKNAEIQKLYSLSGELMQFKIKEMDEEEIEDCINCTIIIDEVDFENPKLKQIIDNSEKTYYIRNFTKKPLNGKEIKSFLYIAEFEEGYDMNADLLEVITLVVDGERSFNINEKIYYQPIESFSASSLDNLVSNKEIHPQSSVIEEKFNKTIQIEDLDFSENKPENIIVKKNIDIDETDKINSETNNDLPNEEEWFEEEWFEEVIGKYIVELKQYKSVEKSLYIARDGQIYQRKSKLIALLLVIFLGPYGADKFYLKKPVLGVLYFFTLGLFLVGWLFSVMKIATSKNVYAKLHKIE